MFMSSVFASGTRRGTAVNVASTSLGLAAKVSFMVSTSTPRARCGSDRIRAPMPRTRSMSCTGGAPRSPTVRSA